MTAPRRILIGFAEAVAAPETFFSLTAAGYEVDVFTRRGDRCLLAERLPVRRVHQVTAPELDVAGCLADLRRIDLDGVVAAMALDDASLLLLGTSADPVLPIPLASASGESARFALDKRRQIAAAAAAGLPVPETKLAANADEAADFATYPGIARPALALTLADNRLVKRKNHFLMGGRDLDNLRRQWPAGDTMLLQPLIKGRGAGLFGFGAASGVKAFSAHVRLRMMNPHGSGASACRSETPDPSLVAAAARMVEASGWRGPFMVELLQDDAGRSWFVEFNGRLWGSLALARRAGFEYPAWAVAQALDSAFDPPGVDSSPVSLRHLGRDLVHLAFVLKGPSSAFHRERWPGLIRSAASVLRPAHGRAFYNYDSRWPTYFLFDAVHTVMAQWRKPR